MFEESEIVHSLRGGQLNSEAWVCPENGRQWISVADYGPFARALPPLVQSDRWWLRALLLIAFFSLMLWGVLEYLSWSISEHANELRK